MVIHCSVVVYSNCILHEGTEKLFLFQKKDGLYLIVGPSHGVSAVPVDGMGNTDLGHGQSRVNDECSPAGEE